nr:MAG TPA: hypothetical protein [Caudoviricetes sp.]
MQQSIINHEYACTKSFNCLIIKQIHVHFS